MNLRYHDWPTRLDRYFNECVGKPFELGQFDCGLFACGSLQAMTGIHPLQQYIGEYDSKLGLAKHMKLYSGGGLLETAQKACLSVGVNPVPPALAKRGDMVMINQDGVEAWGVVDLDARFARVVSSNEGGIGRVPIRFATHCWSFN